jgi:hypothetical protein
MSVKEFVCREPERLGRRLAGIYSRTLAWYVLGVAVLWVVGVEASYGCPTPFYALLEPAFDSLLVPIVAVGLMYGAYVGLRRHFGTDTATGGRIRVFVAWGVWVAVVVSAFAFETRTSNTVTSTLLLHEWDQIRWHVLALLVFVVFFAGLLTLLQQVNESEDEWSPRATAWFLAGVVLFAFLFAGSIAMIRNGLSGITQAYQRHGYEYISDIGVTGTIRALFRDYLKVRPYLSMHAKVHPPGPIVLLWLLSYVAGQEPLGLSLATMVVGVCGIVPLYFWARELAGRRVALTCCVLYGLMPSIVLFTATSADIAFTPFSLATLFLFWRALHRRSWPYALAAGAGYALLSLLSFSLVSLGAFFVFVGLWRLAEPRWRGAVIQTAVVMALGFLAVHLALRWWSGFDVIACFHACREQFNLDQANVDRLTPRFPSWTWEILNPLCWFFFAGIPVSLLFTWRLATWSSSGDVPSDTPNPKPQTPNPTLIICGLTLLVLSLLYLGRGEGERSAMYVLPFVALPAAHLLDQMGRMARSYGPLGATCAFLAFQCWLTESLLYTFW